MNILPVCGDLCHLLAMIILLLKIWKTKSCSGISGKSQFLFALTYTARYMEVLWFTKTTRIYNSVFKALFIVATYSTLYLMYVKFKATYDSQHDTFRINCLLGMVSVSTILLLLNRSFYFKEVVQAWSIYLESVAILPQLLMISKTGEADTISSHYLFALGSNRALYILNWIYQYMNDSYFDPIATYAGIAQTVFYCDLFYLYITKVLRIKKLKLPV